MVRGHTLYLPARLLLAVAALLLMFAVAARVASAAAPDHTGNSYTGKRMPAPGGGGPDSPGNEAFLEIVPSYDAPDNGGSVSVGQRFVLELWVNAGTHTDLTSYQAYLTFTNQTLQNVRVDRIETTCVASNGLTGDYTTFDASIQNVVCNGPGNCLFHGVNAAAGSIAFSSGALFKCHEGCGDTFRVAQIGMCAVAPGQGTLRWQFDDKGPLQHNTKIIDYNNREVQNSAFFTDYTVHVFGGTLFTPVPVYTPSDPTSSPTSVPITVPPTSIPPANTQVPTVQLDCLNGFLDVQSTDYFAAAVRNLYCMGSVTGYNDGTFRPYSYTSRGQLAKIVVLANGWSVNMGGGPHFVDVPAGSPFYPYIETASNRGIITGYSDGTFRPSDKVTRGQLCKVIALSQGWPADTYGGSHFTDVPESHPFYRYIETAYRQGIITGYGDRTFRPTNMASRGQISKVIYSALTTH